MLQQKGTTVRTKTVAMLTIAAATIGASIGPALGQETSPATPRPVLRYSIVGSSSCDTRPCFFGVMRHVEVQELLLDLAVDSLPVDVAAARLDQAGSPSLEDLVELRLVRREDDGIRLNFALFTATDLKRIREVSRRAAASLAAALMARQSDIEAALASYDAPGVDRREVAFFLLGCASLDWDGLAVTAAQGYRKATDVRPDGRYVPAAQEIVDLSMKRIYWGSHNTSVDGIRLTSFGDHHALPRTMLPDLLWATPGFPDSVPERPRPALDKLLSISFQHTGALLGRIMLALRDRSLTVAEAAAATGTQDHEASAALDALLALDYVSEHEGRFQATVPVLGPRDEAMARAILATGNEVMRQWLASNFASIKNELSDLSFTRSGVPFEEGFTMVWHYIFGMANQKLVEAGLFTDPYSPERGYKGAFPVVYTLDWL